MGAALRDSDGKLSLTTRIMIAMGPHCAIATANCR